MPKLENWKFAVKRAYRLFQALGFHVTPNHFYEPLPDTRELGDSLWTRRIALPGIDFTEDSQLTLLKAFAENYKAEYDQLPKQPTSNATDFYLNNSSFNRVDAEAYYCFLRHFQPRRVMEIGSGMSTLLATLALKRNHQQNQSYACEYAVIDPFPSRTIVQELKGIEVYRKPVQQIPLSEFGRLQSGDFLFIDSSHVLKIGSDVQYEFLEILPRLNPGVIVHLHDIFLPAEYPRVWVMNEFRFWNEQYILQAFLTHNREYEILFGASYLHLKHPAKLSMAFSSYEPKVYWPGSFWMRKKQTPPA